jgi:transcriptional regulator with XRE-family HTH domain
MRYCWPPPRVPGREEVAVFVDTPTPHPIQGILAMREISKLALAQATGYTRQYVSMVVLGRVPAHATFRRRCAEALGMPEDELFHPPARKAGRRGDRTLNRVAAS